MIKRRIFYKVNEGSGLQHISNILRNMCQPSSQQKIALPNRDGGSRMFRNRLLIVAGNRLY